MRWFTSGRYAAVTSTLALVIAAGGTSYAAVQLTGHDIQDGTITTKDVKDKNLKVKDLSPDAVSALKGQTGPAGPAGPQGAAGAQGQQGVQGPVGPSNAYSVWNDNYTLLTGTQKNVLTMSLPAGSYTLSAKAIVYHSAGAGTYGYCYLTGGGQLDVSATTAYDPGGSYSMLNNQIVFTTNATSNVTLACASSGGTNYVFWKKMTAIKVGSVSNTPGADVARPAADSVRSTLP
jgi:hypothetical protein